MFHLCALREYCFLRVAFLRYAWSLEVCVRIWGGRGGGAGASRPACQRRCEFILSLARLTSGLVCRPHAVIFSKDRDEFIPPKTMAIPGAGDVRVHHLLLHRRHPACGPARKDDESAALGQRQALGAQDLPPALHLRHGRSHPPPLFNPMCPTCSHLPSNSSFCDSPFASRNEEFPAR